MRACHERHTPFICVHPRRLVVHHSYGPLLLGAATVLFEGKPVGTPDAATYWRVAQRNGVAALFTAPTALRAIKKQDPDGREWRVAGVCRAAAQQEWTRHHFVQ
jgi:acyl-coenzyme A synthetase/AMP-(fatty) acid ligase